MVKFNPKYGVVASGGNDMVVKLWHLQPLWLSINDCCYHYCLFVNFSTYQNEKIEKWKIYEGFSLQLG